MRITGSSYIPEMVANVQVIVDDTDVTTVYAAVAPIGTALSSAAWMAWKKVITVIGTTTTIVITWADGDSSYDNVATDLTALTYN